MSHKSSERSSPGTVPPVGFVALGLLSLALISEATVEPYPSITMPGFHEINAVVNVEDVGFRHLRIEYPDQTVTLTRDQMFASAPPGQRLRMAQRLDGLSGTDAEWAWIDDIGRRLPMREPAEAVELVMISQSGRERTDRRLERP